MLSLYRFVLALHIISIVCWMAGLLYLFRLCVYHAAETEPVVKARFAIMENKLYRIITLPAMIASFIFGVAMLSLNPSLFHQAWMNTKFFLVALLIGATHMGGKWIRELQAGTCKKSEKFFRVFNEVPTLLMIVIIMLVILKPF